MTKKDKKDSTQKKQKLVASFPQLGSNCTGQIAMPYSMLNPYSKEKSEAIILSLKQNHPQCSIKVIPTGPLYRFNYLLKYVFSHEKEEAMRLAIQEGDQADKELHNNLIGFIQENDCEALSWHRWIGSNPMETNKKYEQLCSLLSENSEAHTIAKIEVSETGLLLNNYEAKYYIFQKIIEKHTQNLNRSVQNYLIYRRIIEDELKNDSHFNSAIIKAALKFLMNLMSNSEYNFFTEKQVEMLSEKGNMDIARDICKEFLIEEFAVTMAWIREGFTAMIYTINANPILNNFNEYLYKLYGKPFNISDIKFETPKKATTSNQRVSESFQSNDKYQGTLFSNNSRPHDNDNLVEIHIKGTPKQIMEILHLSQQKTKGQADDADKAQWSCSIL